MENKMTRMGLSILAGGLSFVGSASAVDIVIDGSYESATNQLSGIVGIGGGAVAGIDTGWTTFSAYAYAAGYTQAGPAGSGQVYLRPYPPGAYGVDNSSTTVNQIDSLTRAITGTQIDAGQGQYTLSAWFSTYYGNNDYSELTLQFLDGSQNVIGDPINLGGAAFVAALPGGTGLRAWGKDSQIGLIPTGARYASITTASHALSGQPDGYVDLVSLDVSAGFLPIQVISTSPANNATGVSPQPLLTTVLQDGMAALDTNSIRLSVDGLPVTPLIQKPDARTTVQYQSTSLLPALSSHSYKLAFNNSGGAIPNATNEYNFTVASWANVDLGTPLFMETFNNVAEGALPAGWTVANLTDPDAVPGADLNNFHSDSYLDWVVISRSTLSNLTTVTPGGADMVGVFNVAPNQVVNSNLVTDLIDGNFIFAVSDRSGGKQVQYLFSPDYNLSGQTNIYLSFNSIWTQNQDSLASAEYSIDHGATWLPALYLLDGPDVLKSGGSVEGSNTLAAIYSDVPNLEAATLGNGYYGQFIGLNSNQWASAAAFISPRVDDDETESHRVEVLRLAQADNQPAVRFRFANVGTYSWYWGIDNVAIYSVAVVAPPSLTAAPTPASQTVAVGNSASITIGSPLGTGPFTYQWRQEGTNLPGKTAQTLDFPNIGLRDAGNYDVVVSNKGGSVTSPPPAAVLIVINPTVQITGQWDFLGGNLAATIGKGLEFYDSTVQADTTFGTTTALGIPDINGQATGVMRFVPSVPQWGGYRMYHGALPNGGGAYVNQYTLIFDVYYPAASADSWRSLFQTATANDNDGDLFVSPGDGIGISSTYTGNVTPEAWHRIAFGIDLTGPGPHPVLTKFIDGVKVGQQTLNSGADGRWALDPTALLFADNDGDTAEAFVSSVQFSNGRWPDAYLTALGGTSAAKIPGVIKVAIEGGKGVIRWTGGVPLQTTDSLTGPWTTLSVSSPYEVPAGSTTKFYRPKIP
jgi:hypothetical protein